MRFVDQTVGTQRNRDNPACQASLSTTLFLSKSVEHAVVRSQSARFLQYLIVASVFQSHTSIIMGTDEEQAGRHQNEATKASSRSADDEPSASVRQVVGSGAVKFSDFVNDNLIVVRYAAFAGVSLLAIYGMVHTPLFFRYRNVGEVPAELFRTRRKLRCRLMHVDYQHSSCIRCHVRHLSPIECLLPRSWLDWFLRLHPSSALGRRPDQSPDELLDIQLAGVEAPPDYFGREEPGDWLRQLVKERPILKCQLLARRVQLTDDSTTWSASNDVPKRKIPELVASDKQYSSKNQVAMVKLFFRPNPFQLFANDLAESMVERGRAVARSDGLYSHGQHEQLVDASDSVKLLEQDARYLDRLSRAEYKAAAGLYGMWADSSIQKERSDVMEEVDFQTNAPAYKKLWRWLRGD